MRVLVTGGAGFIGSNFVHYILEQTRHDVVTLDALTYAGDIAKLEDLPAPGRHEFVEGNICHSSEVTPLADEVDVIVNFAAETHVDRSIQDATPFVETNIEGTQTLLDAAVAAGIDRFIQISTDEVYGQILEGEFTESDPLNPRNPYSATKAAADHLVLSYHTTHDLPTIIVRPSNNFGPRQHTEKLIPKLITNAAAGEALPIYGDGTNVREWTYVTDTCRAIRHLVEHGNVGEIYNVGSGHERQNIDIAETIVDELDASKDLIEFIEDRPGHDQRYALDTSKIEKLGWEPKWTFEEGLAETTEYYLH